MKVRYFIADLKFSNRLLLTCFSLISSFSHTAFSDELDQNVLWEFQTQSHYWAFNGPTAKDSELIDELLNNASALSEVLGSGHRDEIKVLMKSDVNAQGGPQILLSSRAIPLVADAIKNGKYSDLNRFINSLSKVNAPLAEMVTAFANFSEHKPYKMPSELIVSPEHRKHCLLTCASKQLGLQQNETFQYLIGTSTKKPSRQKMDREIIQIQLHFPHDKIDEKVHFKSGIDPLLASTSSADSRCISSCIGTISQEIAQWTAIFTGIGRVAGSNGAIAGFTTGVLFGGAIGAGRCVHSADCGSLANKQARNDEKKADLDARENSLRESELKDREQARREKIDREKRQHEEQDKEMAQKKIEEEKRNQEKKGNEDKKKEDTEAKVDQKRKQDKIEAELRDGKWADRKKNADAQDDSSISCSMSRTCDGTMDALVEKNSEFERRHFNPEIDGPKRHLSSTPIPGLEDESERGSLNDYLNEKEDIFSNRPKNWEPSENKVQLDSTGNGIKKWDMTSTPMPSIK